MLRGRLRSLHCRRSSPDGSSWNAGDARGTGAVWLDVGVPDEAHGTFYPYQVEVRAFRPRNGVFTRLAFVYWSGDVPHATVRSAHFYPGTPASEFLKWHRRQRSIVSLLVRSGPAFVAQAHSHREGHLA